jgi:hypothetical protein
VSLLPLWGPLVKELVTLSRRSELNWELKATARIITPDSKNLVLTFIATYQFLLEMFCLSNISGAF